MKIEELTIRDIKTICKKHKRCYKCPLENHTWRCMGLKNMTEKEMKSEVGL